MTQETQTLQTVHPTPPKASRNGADAPDGDRLREITSLVRRLLTLLGEDPDRPGLTDTPSRVARSLRELTRGYDRTAADAVGKGVFREEHGSMVIVRDIELFSLCEHHMLPFFGRVHVGYVPDGRIVGLSKIARIVEVFARRLQVQERLTEEIADAIEAELEPQGVGLVVEARHLCMMMRGVEKSSSRTVTRAFRGSLAELPSQRDDFLRAVPS